MAGEDVPRDQRADDSEGQAPRRRVAPRGPNPLPFVIVGTVSIVVVVGLYVGLRWRAAAERREADASAAAEPASEDVAKAEDSPAGLAEVAEHPDTTTRPEQQASDDGSPSHGEAADERAKDASSGGSEERPQAPLVLQVQRETEEEVPPTLPAPSGSELRALPEAAAGAGPASDAGNGVRSVKLESEPPTLHCLGFRWYVEGDADGDAVVEVRFRRAGGKPWREALPLRRVEVEALEDRRPPAGQGLFAGSVLFLEPDTAYEVRLELKDPDGGGAVEERRARTWAEPFAPAPLRTIHVAPGPGGGSGTERSPFRGLAAAEARTRPGDLCLVHKGVYGGPLSVTKSGTLEAPIVWRGAGDGEAVIEGSEEGPAIRAYKRSHVFFEGITIRKARYGVHLNGSRNLVIRRCHFDRVGTGVFGDAVEHRIFVCDNLIEGIEPWPKPKGHKSKGEYRGVELSGTGSVVCHNTVHNFRDGVDTRKSWPVRAIDIHNNEISECSDDGIELDFSEHNTRAYLNRVTNVSLGISFQPIHGGPAYAVRNVLYNVGHETFKLHLTPTNRGSPDWEEGPHRTSGGVIIHNTVVKSGPPLRVWSNEGPVHRFYLRNNLLVGASDRNAIEITCPMKICDLDYNAYVSGGRGFSVFASWNKSRYGTIADFAARAGQERHGHALASHEGVFASNVEIPDMDRKYGVQDLRLSPRSPVIDRGEVLPGVNDDFKGRAPDLGALEFGAEMPRYGVRPLRGRSARSR